MAGGRGERFWPKSRISMPKQFLSLTDDERTMLQHTVERMLPVVEIGDIYIVTNTEYINLVAEQLPELPKENILAEPYGRNTAPCIALASAVISAKYKDAVMFVMPSDHIIKNIELFADTLLEAAEISEKDENLITIGITPSYAETGYGYIQFTRDKSARFNNSYKVLKFVEKPDAYKAAVYIKDGRYLWNSGMFVWKLSTILKSFKNHLPNLFVSIQAIRAAVGTDNFQNVICSEYEHIKPESIDYGIMEKADNIYTIPGSFGWDDVGGWLALERINQTDERGNFLLGNIIEEDTENSIVISKDKLVATVGVNNMVIVVTDDAVLVCNKDNTQDVKKIVAKLKEKNLTQYL
jgi:mannose-1-phosphate guanylyltransferase